MRHWLLSNLNLIELSLIFVSLIMHLRVGLAYALGEERVARPRW